jgi:hypothetical protein
LTGEAEMKKEPNVQILVALFKAIENQLSDLQKKMLKEHYNSPERIITTQELVEKSGFEKYNTINYHYGNIAVKMIELVGQTFHEDIIKLELMPKQVHAGILCEITEDAENHYHWKMRPEVAQALEELHWV